MRECLKRIDPLTSLLPFLLSNFNILTSSFQLPFQPFYHAWRSGLPLLPIIPWLQDRPLGRHRFFKFGFHVGSQHGSKIYQNADQKAMRILNATIIDLCWKTVPKKRPGSSHNRTKNTAKNERNKCMEKVDAENAEAAEEMSQGRGGPSKT